MEWIIELLSTPALAMSPLERLQAGLVIAVAILGLCVIFGTIRYVAEWLMDGGENKR